ncbi:PilZ domain-containing protein [Sphingomonas flavalba]|uniref:PilZ domain-containing protein n=1 Tax=Sphingomonas flavalba TaxID=2559804 RepID=UPI00109DC157|nr:PilZ domain-containing protein [Sphingomonas flavalba]
MDNGNDTANTQNRVTDRATVSADVKLRLAGGKPIDVRLIDLSTSGFRTEFVSRLHTGDHLWLILPGLAPLFAKVAWSDGVVTGCHFEKPIHIAVFDRIVETLR